MLHQFIDCTKEEALELAVSRAIDLIREYHYKMRRDPKLFAQLVDSARTSVNLRTGHMLTWREVQQGLVDRKKKKASSAQLVLDI